MKKLKPLYTKQQLKRAVRRAMREPNCRGRVRRRTKGIHLLINIKSHNINPYGKGSKLRRLLAEIRTCKAYWSGAIRRHLVFNVHLSDHPGKHSTFSNQFNHHIVDDLPF